MDISDLPPGEVVKHRKSFFLMGVVPTKEINLREICPYGTVSITENTSFLDGFLRVVTLGIYTPRTTVYTCAKREA